MLSIFGDNGPIAGAGGSYLRTYTWGLQLSVPLFDGFRLDARLEEPAAAHEELSLYGGIFVLPISLSSCTDSRRRRPASSFSPAPWLRPS